MTLLAGILSLSVAADLGADDGPFTPNSAENPPMHPTAGLRLPTSLRDALEPETADEDDKDTDRRRSDRIEFSIGPMGGYGHVTFGLSFGF